MKTIILPVQLVQPQAQLKYQFLMELKINIFKLNLLFYPKNISAVLWSIEAVGGLSDFIAL